MSGKSSYNRQINAESGAPEQPATKAGNQENDDGKHSQGQGAECYKAKQHFKNMAGVVSTTAGPNKKGNCQNNYTYDHGITQQSGFRAAGV